MRNRGAISAVNAVMETVQVEGASLIGTGAERVVVEAQFEAATTGRTEVVITGLPDTVIKESRGRLLCALKEAGFPLGPGRLHLNLVPAARPKSGEILDLPLVLAAAAAAHKLPRRAFDGALFLGEVGINGDLHPVAGGLAAGVAAREAGRRAVVAPLATAREAACLPELIAYGAEHLGQVVAHLLDDSARLEPLEPAPLAPPHAPGEALDAVRGHGAAKRTLQVAAAGGHGLLMLGPPGAGKSMLARGLVDLLPLPNLEERLEITRVLSAAGRWPKGLAPSRPFRAPHHSASHAGLVGGGPGLAPGEATLAHCGVLFLDELPEFKRDVLEGLRTPLESGEVHLSRAGRRAELPARFQLVAAMNPCPCGYRGHPRRVCRCAPAVVRRYRGRISGPLLDRIDLRLELAPPAFDDLTGPHGEHDLPATHWIAGVELARERQAGREQSVPNGRLAPEELDRVAPLVGAARELLARAAEQRALSARAVQSLRRVARTVADLQDQAEVDGNCIAQALGLREELTVLE